MFSLLATSAPSKSLFSTTGNVIIDKRNRLTYEHADQLIFLFENHDEVKLCMQGPHLFAFMLALYSYYGMLGLNAISIPLIPYYNRIVIKCYKPTNIMVQIFFYCGNTSVGPSVPSLSHNCIIIAM